MSRPPRNARRPRRLGVLAPVLAGLALALALAAAVSGIGGGARAVAQTGGAEETAPQTDASVPAREVTMIGSSPQESPGETWGLGQENGAATLVRYTPATGWTLGSPLLDSQGQPLSGFELDRAEGFQYPEPSILAGQMTPGGSGVLAGCTGCKTASPHEMLLVRNPGGSFQETAPPPSEGGAALAKSERLLGNNSPPLVAALEEGGHAGALVVPVDEEDNRDERVLHWDGSSWTSERIEVPAASSEELQVLGISASSPQDAWLIARLSSSYPAGSVALFRREPGTGGEPPTWQPVRVSQAGEAGEPLSVPVSLDPLHEEAFTVPDPDQSQVLTATAEGVWIDGERTGTHSTVTMFFKPEEEKPAGEVQMAWCNVPQGASAPSCEGELPEALPTARARSFAWPNPSDPYGERVITGFEDGVSLRLEDGQFRRVLALGGGLPSRQADVGGTFGSAFSSAHEGWLGQELLPVHLAPRASLPQSRLESWPVPFHRPLVALASQPSERPGEHAVAASSSEAIAVGEGEVARYSPGEGWLPETLLGPGGRHEAPPLRAVAWPTPARIYAVGASFRETRGHLEPQRAMWLWRAETGLWEPDPAAPLNFVGNLLGIAFQEGEPTRGYAVGQNGVLLSYGKTWTQEPTCGPEVQQPCLPAQVAGASFTSIAFAGPEAIVAYRKLVAATDSYEGGLLVNDGAGWRIDEAAASAMGTNVPWAVAALPDGGAAFAAGAHIFEREAAGAPWQETPTPYPGDGSPGSLAIFREGGAVRVIATGTVPETLDEELKSSPPPGLPPALIPPYPLESSQERGVLRQTADGWSDEEHELNNVQEPPGDYAKYDTVYQPDAAAAVLVNAAGSEGWAVGGNVGEAAAQETADVWRYPGEGRPHVTQAPIATQAGSTVLAFGGNAQCEAPCADRALAGVGPDVWLSHALEEARDANARAFFYTGPRVTTGRTAGPATLAIPYAQETGRYAELIAASPLETFAAASPTDLDLARNEQLFGQAFGEGASAFTQAGGPSKGFPFANPEACEDGSGAGGCYYSVAEAGVRVIVLDDGEPAQIGEELFATQLGWLERELAQAGGDAIVVGSGDLEAQIAAGGLPAARALAIREALTRASALAYFFDSPEQNVQQVMQGGVKSYGSGTLGYVNEEAQQLEDFIGASGFLLAEVTRAAAGARPQVTVKLIPDIGELALEGKQGTLLARSQPAEFAALARRPRSGNDASNGSTSPQTDPYLPIPDNCVGTECARGELPEYEFRSSNASVGMFVKPNTATKPISVLQEASGHPVFEGPAPQLNPQTGYREQVGAKSGLFCALNHGTTVVTIIAGGLEAKLPVTVQEGSVEQPCGTVPAEKPLVSKQQAAPVPAPAPAPTPAGPAPASSPPPVPVPAPPLPAAALPAPAVRAPAPTAPPEPLFLPLQAPTAALIPFVPLPVPTPARPTPPSGTSAVTSPVEAPEREEEQEAAPESVSNEASAYRTHEHEPVPEYLLGIVVLAALAGASARRRPRRQRRQARVAPATISASRMQRRASRRGRLW